MNEGTEEETGATLDEVADDLVSLRAQVAEVSRIQQQLVERVGSLEQGIQSVAREHNITRTDLLGDRKALIGMSVLNALAPFADRLQLMLSRLDVNDDSPLRRQVEAILVSTSNLLRGLGFEAYEPDPGVVFDPAEMSCISKIDDNPDATVVHSTVAAGFRAGPTVARPASVVLTTPQALETETDE